MQVRCDSHSVLVQMCKNKLHCSEEASGARDGCSHEVELPQHILPLLHAKRLLVSQVHKYLHHPLHLLIGKFHGPFVCIKDPTQNLFALVPATVTFVHLPF